MGVANGWCAFPAFFVFMKDKTYEELAGNSGLL
jgi:hypothetical protein